MATRISQKQTPTISLPGWQSWSPAGRGHSLLPLNLASPHGNDNEHVPLPIHRPTKKPAHGWSSWHAFGTHVNEGIILHNARLVAPYGTDLFVQIDDGWTTWGDWLTPNTQKFPCGIKHTANAIQKMGLKAGLWIAPLLVEPSSLLVRTHPEWLVRNLWGVPIEGRRDTPVDRFLPQGRFLLDLANPNVWKYLHTVIETLIDDWGIGLLKLDFLYAGHFDPRYKKATIPDTLLHSFLKEIQRKYPGVYTIACGCPLRPAVGVVDAMRMSEDIVIPGLHPLLRTPVHTQKLHALVENMKKRKHLEKIWHPDPDGFVSHPSFGFTPKQVDLLFTTIMKAKGVRFSGDNLSLLSKEERDRYLPSLLIY